MKHLYLTYLDYKNSKIDNNHFILGNWFNRNTNKFKKNVLLYHWRNIITQEKDYIYLKKTRFKIMNFLMQELNKFHCINYSKQEWAIILEPFLQTYLTVIFDRWKTINNLSRNKKYKVNFYRINSTDFCNINDFIENSFSEAWNQKIFQEIIAHLNFKNIKKINHKKILKQNRKIYPIESKMRILDYFILLFDKLFFNKYKKIFFFDYNFNKFFFFKLNLSNNLFPNFISVKNKINFHYKYQKKNYLIRNLVFSNYKSENNFEKFFIDNLKENIPTFCIEDFKEINKKLESLSFFPKYIFSFGEHWHNQNFKIWLARKVHQGSKFISIEHGGSFPYKFGYFGFEEEMAHTLIKWHTPMHKKHKQLISPKIFEIKSSNKIKKNCSIIYDRFFNFTLTLDQPVSGSEVIMKKNLSRFVNNLDNNIKKFLKIKFHPSDYFNMQKISKVFENFHEREKNIYNVFSKSKIVICFYPETTFSEAIASNIPTILFLKNDIYKLHNRNDKIIKKLKKEKIIFDDPREMARHVNHYWNNFDLWWNNKETKKVVNIFKKEFLGINNKTPFEQWVGFLKKLN
jgi:putative transferase (TIGR04331 family)